MEPVSFGIAFIALLTSVYSAWSAAVARRAKLESDRLRALLEIENVRLELQVKTQTSRESHHLHKMVFDAFVHQEERYIHEEDEFLTKLEEQDLRVRDALNRERDKPSLSEVDFGKMEAILKAQKSNLESADRIRKPRTERLRNLLVSSKPYAQWQEWWQGNATHRAAKEQAANDNKVTPINRAAHRSGTK